MATAALRVAALPAGILPRQPHPDEQNLGTRWLQQWQPAPSTSGGGSFRLSTVVCAGDAAGQLLSSPTRLSPAQATVIGAVVAESRRCSSCPSPRTPTAAIADGGGGGRDSGSATLRSSCSHRRGRWRVAASAAAARALGRRRCRDPPFTRGSTVSQLSAK